MGEVGEAEAWFARAREAAGAGRMSPALGLVRYFENFLWMVQGRWAESERAMAALLDEVGKFKFPFARSGIALWLGRAKIHLGRAEEGLRLVEEASAERERIGQRLLLSMNHIARAEGLRSLGRREEALAATRDAREAARGAGEEATGLLAREREARILCEMAEPGGLRPRAESYEEVLGQLERLGMRPEWARGRKRLAAWLGRLGEEARAEAMGREARQYLASIGALDAEAELASVSWEAGRPSGVAAESK